jgi:hypothetical protein
MLKMPQAAIALAAILFVIAAGSESVSGKSVPQGVTCSGAKCFCKGAAACSYLKSDCKKKHGTWKGSLTLTLTSHGACQYPT